MNNSLKSIVAAAATALLVMPALAGPPGHAKQGNKHGGQAQHHVVGKHAGKTHAVAPGTRFHRGQQVAVANTGCPPGLAKKNNGCLPPGQAKKLLIGQPIPAGASYSYAVPPAVLHGLPLPPAGYRYAVVGNDVVLVNDANIVANILRGLIG